MTNTALSARAEISDKSLVRSFFLCERQVVRGTLGRCDQCDGPGDR